MKKILLLLIVVFQVCNVDAQLLYRISGNGLEGDSYLFATHHLIPVSFLDSVPNLFKSYNDCDRVLGEIVIDETEAIAKMSQSAFMDQDLLDLISAADSLLLDSVLRAELKLGVADLRKMRPAMIQNMYTISMFERKFPELRGNVSMDAFFQHLAAKQGLTVGGLETIDDQIDILFKSQSVERQVGLLLGTVKERGSVVEDYNKLGKQYRKGDLDAIYVDFHEDESDYNMNEGEKFIFLFNRNNKWIDNIEENIKKERCFIAVGALHLPGEDGLLRLLKNRGYKVRAVR